ncbi:MAG TPA: hypothetical protein DCW90_09515 [Lachnospiraceae bacterium]|nr:hypothetical protein [Lachnospiraceae bacterium]
MGTILRYKVVTTRKPHVCFGCGREFRPPCRMISAASTDGGTVSSYYLCETCDKISSKRDCWDEYCFGDFRDEALEMERVFNSDEKVDVLEMSRE